MQSVSGAYELYVTIRLDRYVRVAARSVQLRTNGATAAKSAPAYIGEQCDLGADFRDFENENQKYQESIKILN